jgi:hypothetical protein
MAADAAPGGDLHRAGAASDKSAKRTSYATVAAAS